LLIKRSVEEIVSGLVLKDEFMIELLGVKSFYGWSLIFSCSGYSPLFLIRKNGSNPTALSGNRKRGSRMIPFLFGVSDFSSGPYSRLLLKNRRVQNHHLPISHHGIHRTNLCSPWKVN
jgi:hypothetical protein